MKCAPLNESLFEMMPVAGKGPQRLHFDHSVLGYDEWRALRRGYIGASEVSAILGLNKYSGPFDLAAVKLGEVDPVDPSLPMRMGTFFEPAIREFFASELADHRVEVAGGIDHEASVRAYPYTLRHERLPMFCCNLDGVIIPSDGGDPWAMEIKDAGVYAKSDLRHWLDGDKPEGTALMYWVQIQAQLAVSGLSRALVVIRCEKSLMVGAIYRNEAAITKMEAQVSAFWDRYLAADIMPPMDQHAGGVLSQMHPPESERGTVERLDLVERVKELRSDLVDVKKQIKKLEANKATIENEFKHMIGDHEVVTFGEGIKPIKWKTVSRKSGASYRKLTV